MKPTLHIALLSAAALAIACLVSAWRSARLDSQRLTATLAAQNSQLRDATDRQKQRDAQLAAALAGIQAQTRSVRTPQQAAKAIPSVLPALPLPVTIQYPALNRLGAQDSAAQASACRSLSESHAPQIPNNNAGVSDAGVSDHSADCPTDSEKAPSSATTKPASSAEPPPATLSIPEPDLQPLFAQLQNCRAMKLEADAAQQDLSDEKARSASLLRERDAALAAARGGSLLTRLKRSAKWFAIGALAGAALTAVAHR